MSDTYLKSFISDKLSKHIEPQRLGTPRGEKIGFPKVKYHTALLVGLTRAKQKDIAAHLRIGYSLVRKWKYDFKNGGVVESLQEEFAAGIMQKTLILCDDYSEFSDADNYSYGLRAAIRVKFNEELQRLLDSRNFCQMRFLWKLGYTLDYYWRLSDGFGQDEARRYANQIWSFSPELKAKATAILLNIVRAVFLPKERNLTLDEMRAVEALDLLEKDALLGAVGMA